MPAHGRPVHRRDVWLVHLGHQAGDALHSVVQFVAALGKRAVPSQQALPLGLPLHVHPRAEAAPFPGENDGSRFRIQVGVLEGCQPLVQHLGREGVHSLRPVEGDGGYAIALLVSDLLELHSALRVWTGSLPIAPLIVPLTPP